MRRRLPGWFRGALLAAVAGLGGASLGCGVFEEQPVPPAPTPRAESILANGGFESGSDGWRGLQEQQVDVTSDRARSGDSSLRLALLEGFPGSTVGQPITSETLPEFVSGYYYIEDWPAVPEGEQLYIQLIVSLRRSDLPSQSGGQELHLLLGGVEREPQGQADWRYHFLSREDPEAGEWVYFGYRLPTAFQQAFQAVPSTWESLELRLELKHEAPPGSDRPGAAVFFDDLYAGPQVGAPHPPEHE